MKVLLAASTCLVFTITQTFAISGGPPYPGSTNVIGVYAGVLKKPVDTPPTNDCGAAPAAGCSANSLGVFSVGVADSGLATGRFVMFSQGRVFSGNIQGTADPGKDADSARINAVLSATYNFLLTETTPCPAVSPEPTPACTPSSTSHLVTASANGSLNAHIKTQASHTNLGATSIRLAGNATIDINQGQVDAGTLEPCVTCHMTLKVTGFKQTNTAPTNSLLG